jgi:hypothetical protein
MSRAKSWAARAARSLSAHLDQLRETLERLHGRLREAVAEAVSGSTAVAVKDAVLAALLAHDVAPAYERPPYRPYEQSRYRDDPYWPNREENPHRPTWQRHPDDEGRYEPEERIDEGEHSTEASPDSVGRRWGRAIVLGCQAAAWWLRRKDNGRYAALTAIGVGAAAGVTAFYFGPLIAAAAALAGSTLGLAAMADAARSGATTLLGVGSS